MFTIINDLGGSNTSMFTCCISIRHIVSSSYRFSLILVSQRSQPIARYNSLLVYYRRTCSGNNPSFCLICSHTKSKHVNEATFSMYCLIPTTSCMVACLTREEHNALCMKCHTFLRSNIRTFWMHYTFHTLLYTTSEPYGKRHRIRFAS